MVTACVRHLRNGKVMPGIKTFKTPIVKLIALSGWPTTEELYEYRDGLAYPLRRRVRLDAGPSIKIPGGYVLRSDGEAQTQSKSKSELSPG